MRPYWIYINNNRATTGVAYAIPTVEKCFIEDVLAEYNLPLRSKM